MAGAALTLAHPAHAQQTRLPKVVASPEDGLIILPSGAVKVFVDKNDKGQLGLGNISTEYGAREAVLPDINDAVDGVAGAGFFLVLRANGTVVAWGDNTVGQLGLGIPKAFGKLLKPVPTPTPVPGLSNVRQLATTGGSVFAVLDDGTVKAWGNCGSHLGMGTALPTKPGECPIVTPRTIAGLTGVKSIAGDARFAIALLQDGTVKAWGENRWGEIGIPADKAFRSEVPVTVAGIENAVAVTADVNTAMALIGDGTVRVWGSGSVPVAGWGSEKGTGSNFAGASGPSIRYEAAYPWTATPLIIPGLTNVVSISQGAAILALLNDGSVRMWGYNGHYGMGLGRNIEYPKGLQTATVRNVAAVASGGQRSYFVLKDGSVLGTGPHGGPGYLKVPTVILKPQ